jgi:hypothetical protein
LRVVFFLQSVSVESLATRPSRLESRTVKTDSGLFTGNIISTHESENIQMKNKLLLCGLIAALMLTAACTSTAPTNANTTTNTTTTTTTSNTNANRTVPPASNTNTNANSNSSAQTDPSATAGAQDFTLVNKTGVEIDKVFISPHDADDWEEDILGRDTLPDGQSVDVKFSRNEKAAMWDLRIEDSAGNAIEWESLNLLEISKVTLLYDKETRKARALTE